MRYDNDTRVSYRQRDYAVANLGTRRLCRRARATRSRWPIFRRSDHGERKRAGTGSATEEPGAAMRCRTSREARRPSGVCRLRRGTLEIRDRNNRLVVVSLPYNAPRAITDRLNRLREGDYVRMEGRFLNRERFELKTLCECCPSQPNCASLSMDRQMSPWEGQKPE